MITLPWNPGLFLGSFWAIPSYLFPCYRELVSPLPSACTFPAEAISYWGCDLSLFDLRFWRSDCIFSLPQNNKGGFRNDCLPSEASFATHSYFLSMVRCLKQMSTLCPGHIWINHLIYLTHIQSSNSSNRPLLPVGADYSTARIYCYHWEVFSKIVLPRFLSLVT